MRESHSQKERERERLIIQQLSKQVKALEENKEAQNSKNVKYLEQTLSICNELRTRSIRLEKPMEKLYKLKTTLLSELMSNMPIIGLPHRVQLSKEPPHTKILRHKEQRELKENNQPRLLGPATDPAMRENQQGEAQDQYQVKMNSPIRNDDQESLALSQSYNPSSLKKSKNYQSVTGPAPPPANQLTSFQQTENTKIQQDPKQYVSKQTGARRTQKVSGLQYGDDLY